MRIAIDLYHEPNFRGVKISDVRAYAKLTLKPHP